MSARYPLQGLLELREKRTEDARLTVKEKTQLLQAAVSAENKARAQLSQYIQWKAQEISRRYSAIMEQVLTQNELSIFNAGIASLDLKQLQLEQAAEAAALAVQSARQALDSAKDQLSKLNKARQKLEFHRGIWQVQQHSLMEYQAEQELEDFNVKKPDL
ncbi:MAG: YscO family type III secretion system apparatus protein [Proteobacteria bacterium]|uniref:YscO family type III secretion system apparatus protein n=1 Tax=Candidatus Avisuccinivibrio stercorigallinarum TaxID=2840704 RepID=A0A9D9DBE9_9GAMM|nr:YscO family type III secretion system apparatus protein [Candidatus Avisuccinivibrio stercorigallinarum]